MSMSTLSLASDGDEKRGRKRVSTGADGRSVSCITDCRMKDLGDGRKVHEYHVRWEGYTDDSTLGSPLHRLTRLKPSNCTCSGWLCSRELSRRSGSFRSLHRALDRCLNAASVDAPSKPTASVLPAASYTVNSAWRRGCSAIRNAHTARRRVRLGHPGTTASHKR